MVEATNAAITDVAMDGPRWPKYETGVAELDRLGHDWARLKGTLGHHHVVVLLLYFLELIIEVEVGAEATLLFSRALVSSWNDPSIRGHRLNQGYIGDDHAD